MNTHTPSNNTAIWTGMLSCHIFFLLSSDSLNLRIICHERCMVLEEAERAEDKELGSRRGWSKKEEVKKGELYRGREKKR